jgi:hypothetical protein
VTLANHQGDIDKRIKNDPARLSKGRGTYKEVDPLALTAYSYESHRGRSGRSVRLLREKSIVFMVPIVNTAG